MSQRYNILTWDDEVYSIEEADALKLIDKWTDSEKAFPVDLGGVAISSAAIKSITPYSHTEADRPTRHLPDDRSLKADNRSEEEIYKSARKVSDIIRKRFNIPKRKTS